MLLHRPTPPTPRRRTRRAALPALIALAATALLAPAASADSIVYADQGEIWTMRPDGSGKVQLTTGGGWHSPTQADDGTIAAVQGTGPIVVMARDGRPLRTITTPPARSGDGGTFAPRPVQLSFSPDGTKIAYAYTGLSCPPASTCGSTQRSTFYTASDVTEATPQSVYGNQFSVGHPEWVTNSRTLVFGGSGSQVSIDDLGPGDYSQVPWMTPNADQGDGEVSRDGTRLVTTYYYGKDTILAWFAVKGDVRTETPPQAAADACASNTGDEQYADPSFSPDGTGTAFRSSNGIEVLRFTAFGEGSCATTGESVVLAPTGTTPDWGPADPVTAAYRPPTPSTPQPQPQPGSGAPGGGSPGTGNGGPGATTTVIVGGATRQRLRGTTFTVRCTASVAGTCAATASARLGGRTLRAKGSGKALADRPRTVVLRFSSRDAARLRAALKRGRAAQVTVTVRVGAATAKRRVTLIA